MGELVLEGRAASFSFAHGRMLGAFSVEELALNVVVVCFGLIAAFGMGAFPRAYLWLDVRLGLQRPGATILAVALTPVVAGGVTSGWLRLVAPQAAVSEPHGVATPWLLTMTTIIAMLFNAIREVPGERRIARETRAFRFQTWTGLIGAVALTLAALGLSRHDSVAAELPGMTSIAMAVSFAFGLAALVSVALDWTVASGSDAPASVADHSFRDPS